MNSVGFTFGILVICFTVNYSYALGKRVGRLGGNSVLGISFEVTSDATIATSGQIVVLVLKYSSLQSTTFYDMNQSKYAAIFKETTPTWIDFPFTDESTSSKYSTVKLFGTSIVVPVDETVSPKKPYHLRIEFTLMKGFIVDALDSTIKYEIYSTTANLSDSVDVLYIGNISLKEGAAFELWSGDLQTKRDVSIKTSVPKYLGKEDSTKQIFTLITITK